MLFLLAAWLLIPKKGALAGQAWKCYFEKDGEYSCDITCDSTLSCWDSDLAKIKEAATRLESTVGVYLSISDTLVGALQNEELSYEEAYQLGAEAQAYSDLADDAQRGIFALNDLAEDAEAGKASSTIDAGGVKIVKIFGGGED